MHPGFFDTATPMTSTEQAQLQQELHELDPAAAEVEAPSPSLFGI